MIKIRNSGLLKKEGKRKNSELTKIREILNKYIIENQDIIKRSIVLVFVEEDVDSKQELYKTIDKLGIVCKFDYQKPIQIEKRIRQICNLYKVEIDSQTLKYFIECSRN